MPPKPPLTHFLCLPLHTPSSHGPLSKSLATFLSKTAHARTPEYPDGIPEGAVRPVGTVRGFVFYLLDFARVILRPGGDVSFLFLHLSFFCTRNRESTDFLLCSFFVFQNEIHYYDTMPKTRVKDAYSHSSVAFSFCSIS